MAKQRDPDEIQAMHELACLVNSNSINPTVMGRVMRTYGKILEELGAAADEAIAFRKNCPCGVKDEDAHTCTRAKARSLVA